MTYRQGGSNYHPKFVAGNAIKVGDNPTIIEFGEWYRLVDPSKNSFISLITGAGSRTSIAIPDLIGDIYLKLKYTCGILHWANPDIKLTYVLSDPDTFEPILWQGKDRIYTHLPKYSTSNEGVYFGNVFASPFSLKLLGLGEKASASWDIIFDNASGKWLVTKPLLDTYLCRDFKLRKEDEDPEGLRFGMLNPTIPSDRYITDRAWGYTLLHKAR